MLSNNLGEFRIYVGIPYLAKTDSGQTRGHVATCISSAEVLGVGGFPRLRVNGVNARQNFGM